MGINKLLNYFFLFRLLRAKALPEGRQVFRQNYTGFSRHFRERRYLLMTRKGPVEYVFNFKHYVSFIFLVFIGTITSFSFVINFFIQVIKEDLVSSADATPIIIAEFIDYRAKKTDELNFNILGFSKISSLRNCSNIKTKNNRI